MDIKPLPPVALALRLYVEDPKGLFPISSFSSKGAAFTAAMTGRLVFFSLEQGMTIESFIGLQNGVHS